LDNPSGRVCWDQATDWVVSGWDAAGWESVLAIGPCHAMDSLGGWIGGHGRAEGGLVGVVAGQSWCVRSVQRGEKEGESEEDFVNRSSLVQWGESSLVRGERDLKPGFAVGAIGAGGDVYQRA